MTQDEIIEMATEAGIRVKPVQRFVMNFVMAVQKFLLKEPSEPEVKHD